MMEKATDADNLGPPGWRKLSPLNWIGQLDHAKIRHRHEKADENAHDRVVIG
jgi:hypothetical protein